MEDFFPVIHMDYPEHVDFLEFKMQTGSLGDDFSRLQVNEFPPPVSSSLLPSTCGPLQWICSVR
jgi:hypothetical protein